MDGAYFAVRMATGGGLQARRLTRVADGKAQPAPVEGWDTSSSIADMSPLRAITLENWFPAQDKVQVRRGMGKHRPTGETTPVESLMVYHGPSSNFMFAAADDTIRDVTTSGVSAPVASVSGLNSARFQWVNFTTPGGSFLWVCNGADNPRYFDGAAWATPTITGISASNIIGVAAHKGRLWFTQINSTKAAYLPVGSIQGAATTFELGGFFTKGGYLQAIGSWSVDGGEGPDDYTVFVSSQGQAIIYKGTDPASAATWALVGVFDIGTPIGRRCLRKFGSDLVVVTLDGVIPLSQLLVRDASQRQMVALTGRIQKAMNDAARQYQTNFGWDFTIYPKGTMALLNVPVVENEMQQQYVMNTLSGAWCKFTGWDAASWVVFNDRLFYGGNDGSVYEADLEGADEGKIFNADMRTAFNYYGSKGVVKKINLIQALYETSGSANPSFAIDTDFRFTNNLVAAPQLVFDGAIWDEFDWDEANWAQGTVFFTDYLSVIGIGQCASIRTLVQVVAPTVTNPSSSDRFPFKFELSGFHTLVERSNYI